MGIALKRGRFFTSFDREGQPLVAIINQTLADRFFAGVDPIGKQIKRGNAASTPWMTIVGIVSDVRNQALESEPRPSFIRRSLRARHGCSICWSEPQETLDH